MDVIRLDVVADNVEDCLQLVNRYTAVIERYTEVTAVQVIENDYVDYAYIGVELVVYVTVDSSYIFNNPQMRGEMTEALKALREELRGETSH
jgi:hypothetical protein